MATIGYVTIGAIDSKKSGAFYDALFAALGSERKLEDREADPKRLIFADGVFAGLFIESRNSVAEWYVLFAVAFAFFDLDRVVFKSSDTKLWALQILQNRNRTLELLSGLPNRLKSSLGIIVTAQ